MTPHDAIFGWGADLDPANRPAVPKERTPPRLEGLHWSAPAEQVTTTEILVSTEYLQRPPVFGTTVPPRGISGWIRRRAFRHSENDLRHWLMLLFADRVDAVEGLVADAGRKPATRTALVTAGAAVVMLYCLRHRGSRRRAFTR
jgi:hypothetical protein